MDIDSSIAHLLLFVGALVFCALFSFLETSITALRLFKLKELAQQHGKYKELFKSLEQNPTHLLNTMLVANTLASTTAATEGTFIFEGLFSALPSSIGFSLSILIVTSIILIFGEIVPKNIAKIHGERYFNSTLWLTNLIFFILYPFVILLIRFSNFIIRWFGLPTEHDTFATSEKEIQFLIEYIDEKGLMEHEKTAMLRSIFDLGNTAVKEIMIPSASIISIGAHETVQDAFQLFVRHQFSRIPIYESDETGSDKKNNIIGMIYFKDIIPHMAEHQDRLLKGLVRPILFIPESIKVNQLLKEFKTQNMHIGIVINEHGETTGLVTLEDVLEEIVGEIHDEYESITQKVMSLQPNGWLVDASIELERLEEILNIEFKTDTAVTLGGFLIEQFQHLPKKGERLWYNHYTFQVQQANSKKIIQVLVFKGPEIPYAE
jgi:putative hemolysin